MMIDHLFMRAFGVGFVEHIASYVHDHVTGKRNAKTIGSVIERVYAAEVTLEEKQAVSFRTDSIRSDLTVAIANIVGDKAKKNRLSALAKKYLKPSKISGRLFHWNPSDVSKAIASHIMREDGSEGLKQHLLNYMLNEKNLKRYFNVCLFKFFESELRNVCCDRRSQEKILNAEAVLTPDLSAGVKLGG